MATSEPEDPIHVEKCPVSLQNRNNSSPENSNCTKYCMFWKNQLIDEIVCPRNFHYSPINETCVSSGDNGCGESSNDIQKVDYGSCIGKCPISDDIEDIFYLPHDNCKKYCICAFGHSLEMKCDDNKHFSTLDNRCVHPAEADMKCPDIRHEIEAEAFQETDDCFGECPSLNDNDNRTQSRKISPHRNETKFCVCVNGMFQIHNCPKNQIFIEDDQICRNLNPRSLKNGLHNYIQSNSNNDNSNDNQCSSSDKDKIHTYTKTTETNTTETKNLTDQEKESLGNEETTFETIITKKIKKTDHEIITTVFNTTTTTIVTVTNTVTPLVSGDQNDGSSGSSSVPSPQCKLLIEQLLQKKIL